MVTSCLCACQISSAVIKDVVVEVAVVTVINGGISHISRVEGAVGTAVVVLVIVVGPHTWDCRHCPSALHWETDEQRERQSDTQIHT